MTAARHVESDALGSLREELMRAATRVPAGRRRARRAVVVVAIVVALLAATAGAAELTGFTTGVPAVDELIGVETNTPRPGGRNGRGPPPRPRLRDRGARGADGRRHLPDRRVSRT
jgi:hypothetical protein